ncbi:MAG TPA: ATP cone domain-containing protein, partial [Treponema sp.]|nr:ATP cone domain-containing protein [Treponema sp.]
MIKQVVKRSGNIEAYDRLKIEAAVGKAFKAVGVPEIGDDRKNKVQRIVDRVEELLAQMMKQRHPNSIPAIEEIQDLVETALIESQEIGVAKAYILYRSRHEAIRDTKKLL